MAPKAKRQPLHTINFWLPPSSPLYRYSLNEAIPLSDDPATPPGPPGPAANSTTEGDAGDAEGASLSQTERQAQPSKRQEGGVGPSSGPSPMAPSASVGSAIPSDGNGWRGMASPNGSSYGSKDLIGASYGQIQVLPFPRE